MSPNPRTAAIYYFITALFILLACFDTYFALPLNVSNYIFLYLVGLILLTIVFSTIFQRFYRYHDHLHNKALHEKKRRTLQIQRMPYWQIFKKCFPQCFNVFFTYFVTLTIFPAVLSGNFSQCAMPISDHCDVMPFSFVSDVKKAHDDFSISVKYYTPVTCFLTFNLCSVLGNLIPNLLPFVSTFMRIKE